MPHPCLVQSVKQGFCFSWGSTWQLQFAQEENSQKPEPQLKQPRSSTKETDRTAQTLHDPCRISSKLGFSFQASILKCRWFFGRVFSFPLVEEFV